MSTPSMDDVLHRVAAGELTPEEALALLEPAAEAGAAGTDPLTLHEPPGSPRPTDDAPPVWGTPGHTTSRPSGTPAVIRINASYRSLEVLADPGVAEAAVSGTHTVRRDGDALVVETLESPFGEPGESRGEGRGASFSFADLPRGLAWARSWKEHHLVVRVNPELPVEIDAAGASVRVSGLEAGAKLRLIASALKLERVRGPLDVDALSSSVKGFAAPTGRSRIAAESSSVKLVLGPGSDVTVKARNRMGKVVLPQAVSKGGLVDPDVSEARFGAGTGELVVDAVMSSVMLMPDGGVDSEGGRL